MTTSINAFFRTQLKNISHYFYNPTKLCSKVASAASNIWNQITSGFYKATNNINFTPINLALLSTQKLASKVNDLKNFLYVEFQNATQEPVEIPKEIWDAAVQGNLTEIKRLVPKGRNFISYEDRNNFSTIMYLNWFIRLSLENKSLEAVEFGLDGRKLGDRVLGIQLYNFLEYHKRNQNFLDDNTLSIIKLLLSGGKKIDQYHLYESLDAIIRSNADNYMEAFKILLSDGRKLSQKKLYDATSFLSRVKKPEDLFKFLSLDKIKLPEDIQEYLLEYLTYYIDLNPKYLEVLLPCVSARFSDLNNELYSIIEKQTKDIKETESYKDRYRENIKLLLDYGSSLTLEHRGQLAIDFASMGEVDILQKLLDSGPITKEAKNKAIESDSCFNKEAVIEVLQKATISDFE